MAINGKTRAITVFPRLGTPFALVLGCNAATQKGDIMDTFFETNEIENMDAVVNDLFTSATSKADYADEVHSIPAFRLLCLEA